MFARTAWFLPAAEHMIARKLFHLRLYPEDSDPLLDQGNAFRFSELLR